MLSIWGLAVAGLVGAVMGGVLVWSGVARRPGDDPGPATDRGADVVFRELERARRYERPFALLRVPVHSSDVPGSRPDDEVEAVHGALRTIDFCWIDEAGMHILLPEARRTEGEACIRRLVEVAPRLADADVQLAVFPEDGVTRGALFSRLSGVADVLPRPDDLPLPDRATPGAFPEHADAPAAPRWAS